MVVSAKASSLAVLLVVAACTDPQGTREAGEAYGLTDVQPGGYAAFGCAKNDTSSTKFTATNSRGQRIEGVACSDITPFGKATTIRIVRTLPSAPADATVPMAN